MSLRPSELAGRALWLFDMDGTLTRAAHDFPAIKAELGLPPDAPILEALEELTAEEAAWRRVRLEEMEHEVAQAAVCADGSVELLDCLAERGARVAVITRNSRRNALVTLQVAGLDHFFTEEDVVGRTEAAPKPAPDGIELLVRRNRVGTDEAVLVGDYRFDMMAGRAAGVASVLVDGDGGAAWRQMADLCVASLDEIRAIVESA